MESAGQFLNTKQLHKAVSAHKVLPWMHSPGPAHVPSWWGTQHDRMTVESSMLISGMLLLLKVLFLFLFLFWELPLAKAFRLSNPKYC